MACSHSLACRRPAVPLLKRVERACGTTTLRALSFAARTDAGVHARMNWASCRVALDPRRMSETLQAIAADAGDGLADVQAWALPGRTLARAVAIHKRYRYTIEDSCPAPQPATEIHAWQVAPALRIDAMQKAAALLVGTHDFSAYASAGATGGRIKTLTDITVQRDAKRLIISITGTGFLRYMVRSIVGHLACIGASLQPASSVTTRLQARQLPLHAVRAPAGGLELTQVELANEIQRLIDA